MSKHGRGNMQDLIDWLGDATEGSRELDGEIAATLDFRYPVGADKGEAFRNFWHGLYRMSGDDIAGKWQIVPHYTTSIDAALDLLPAKWRKLWAIHGGDESCQGAQLELPDVDTRDGEIIVNAATPALALCIAGLRARDGEAG